MEKLYNYLKKQKMEGYIPQNVLDKPEFWNKEKINLIREIKLKKLMK